MRSQPPLPPLLQAMSALASSVPLVWWAQLRPTLTLTSFAMTMTPSRSSTHPVELAATPSWSSLLTRWVLLLLAPNTAGCWGAALLLVPSFHPLQATPTSPIRVKVEPSHDASKVKAEGPGLSRTGEDDPPSWRGQGPQGGLGQSAPTWLPCLLRC